MFAWMAESGVFCVKRSVKGIRSFLSRRSVQGRLCFRSGGYCKLRLRYFKLRMWFLFALMGIVNCGIALTLSPCTVAILGSCTFV